MAPNIASNTSVSLDELLDFVRPRHRAILLTRRADGSPQGSPLTCGVDDSGRIVVSTYPERAKTRNAKRDPRVSLIILSDEWNGPWVQIDGTAEVIDSPDSVEPLVEYFRNISGEHPDWDEYRAAMLKQGKSIVRVTPERWGPVATGAFRRGSPRTEGAGRSRLRWCWGLRPQTPIGPEGASSSNAGRAIGCHRPASPSPRCPPPAGPGRR